MSTLLPAEAVGRMMDIQEVCNRVFTEAAERAFANDLVLEINQDHQEATMTIYSALCTNCGGPHLGACRRRARLIATCDARTWKVLRMRSDLSRRQTQGALREMLKPLIKKG